MLKLGSEGSARPLMRRPVGSALLAYATSLLLLAISAGPARAAFSVTSFDGAVTADGSGNVSYMQAGGHPYAVSTSIAYSTKSDPENDDPWPEEPIKDILVDVPPGLVGNPTVVPHCSLDDLVGPDPVTGTVCSPATQVGTATISFAIIGTPVQGVVPLFSMVPPPGVPARFGFNAIGTIVTLDAELRSGSDYGISVNARNVSEGLAVYATSVTLWGTPADPSHTPERACPGGGSPASTGVTCAAGVTPKAFLTMPTSCSGPQTTTLHTDSWFHPGNFLTASFVSHLTAAEGGAPQGATNCDAVPFDPTFEAQPQSSASPGPSGWTFDLRVPQESISNPDLPAQGHLKKASVTMPAGVRVSPSSADGLAACSPAQIGLNNSDDPTCPDASKVGTLTIDTPLLEDQLTGSVFLAKPHDNPTNSLVGIYLVAKGPGLIIKLPGSVSLDEKTGQITATFDNNPQLPFSHLHLEFFGGPRAALSNPAKCGTYTTTAVLTSWSGKTVPLEDSFTTTHDGKGAPCPAAQFKPTFSAGTSTANGLVPAGGSHSSFVLNLTRTDDDEEFAALQSVTMPDGLLAKIAGVPLCAAADVAAGTCGEASRIGTVTTAAGPGPNPFAVKGRVYLGGAYNGAPFSLSIVVPAVAGPFDLGTIVVRAAIFVDPTTAKLDIKADPIPTILQGIPLQVKWISVLIDRPDFFINPTSCNPKSIGAKVVSTAGTVADLSSRFKVNDCASLDLSPKMRLQVGSKGHTKKGASTPFQTTLTQPPGQAGLKSVSVTLPPTLNARLPVVNQACTREAFDAGHCGSDARAGSAEAVTPLLDDPLKGSVYFVKDPTKPKGSLPNLVVALRGQVDFNLIGTIKIPDSGVLGTRFETIPDVPIKKFTLKLVSGKNGPLGTTANLCSVRSKRRVAKIAFRGQNGKLVEVSQRLKVSGCHRRGHS